VRKALEEYFKDMSDLEKEMYRESQKRNQKNNNLIDGDSDSPSDLGESAE
jgi:hypothetical protein